MDLVLFMFADVMLLTRQVQCSKGKSVQLLTVEYTEALADAESNEKMTCKANQVEVG